jgi:hypothetical protein
MTPKDKAIDLFKKYYGLDNNSKSRIKNIEFHTAKKCVLIYIDGLLDFMINKMSWDLKTNGNIHFWQEVKEEVNKL